MGRRTLRGHYRENWISNQVLHALHYTFGIPIPVIADKLNMTTQAVRASLRLEQIEQREATQTHEPQHAIENPDPRGGDANGD